jgi:16S rRNA (guanine966-N2)-methyltransferase
LGGRRLQTPKGIRPTQGIIKEAIFNVLALDVVGARVIDLFAGSGALGIEALSRGAVSATFVELDRPTAAILRQNLRTIGLEERSRVIQADAVRWVAEHPVEAANAGIILMDPPYRDPIAGDALVALDAAAGGTVVVEHADRQKLPELARLAPFRERRYGDSFLTMLRPRPEPGDAEEKGNA